MTRTNVFTLLTVLIRAIALATLVGAIVQLSLSIALWTSPERATITFDPVLIGLVVAALATLCATWVFADVLARLALARPEGQVFDSDIDARQWQTIAFSTVGLWAVVVHGLAAVRTLLFMLVMREQWHELIDDQRRNFEIGLAGDAIGVVIGVALLFGARGLVGLLHRFRYGSQAS